MSNKIIIQRYYDEEHFDILVNDVVVGSFNHDSHGWSGMEAGLELASNIAEQLGIEVEEVYVEDD